MYPRYHVLTCNNVIWLKKKIKGSKLVSKEKNYQATLEVFVCRNLFIYQSVEVSGSKYQHLPFSLIKIRTIIKKKCSWIYLSN